MQPLTVTLRQLTAGEYDILPGREWEARRSPTAQGVAYRQSWITGIMARRLAHCQASCITSAESASAATQYWTLSCLLLSLHNLLGILAGTPALYEGIYTHNVS